MTHERHTPRPVAGMGEWSFPGLTMKVYGLKAGEYAVSRDMENTAQAFIRNDVLPSMNALGDSNGLGFVIIHPGTLGLSISAMWWTQGSVLCQRFFRQLYGTDTPLDMDQRPSIGCVWELAIVAEETRIWRETMMGDSPNAQAYLARFADLDRV